MDCLEDNLNKLESECKKAVEKVVEDVEENPELDKIFTNSCKAFWKKNCQVVSLSLLLGRIMDYLNTGEIHCRQP